MEAPVCAQPLIASRFVRPHKQPHGSGHVGHATVFKLPSPIRIHSMISMYCPDFAIAQLGGGLADSGNGLPARSVEAFYPTAALHCLTHMFVPCPKFAEVET